MRGTLAEVAPPRVDLSTYTDKKLFARARVERATFRRYACYGVAVYAPIAMLPLVLGLSMAPAAQVLCGVAGVLGVALVFAVYGLRPMPRLCARVVLVALLPFLPIVLIALLQTWYSPLVRRSASASNPILSVRVLDEAARRLDGDPDGSEQRDWLGLPERF